MEPSFYENFSRETAARLRAHDQWMDAHEETLREMRAQHTDQMQEMRAQHDDQMTGIRQVMSHLATHMIDHETRLSEHTRTLQEIATTLQEIRDKL